MRKTGRFQVDSRLASLLSQEYSCTEKAIKELVDNAWDADAKRIEISLPEPLSREPIVIADDGIGMSTAIVESNYLKIASDRRLSRGDRTAGGRQVKGRKGVGKFAGLMAASEMRLRTTSEGVTTSFQIHLKDLHSVVDIEALPIELAVDPGGPRGDGTIIILSELHSGLAFPDPVKLRQILLQDYGRERGVAIAVNGKVLGIDDVVGAYCSESAILDGVGAVHVSFAIADEKSVSRQPGIVIRIDGKAIGKPTYFGLETRDDVPPKLLRRLFGELNADGLREHVTVGWDALVENSVLLDEVARYVQPLLYNAFREKFGREIQLAQARLKKEINERLATLPEHRREQADKAIKGVINKFFGEPAEKIEAFVHVLLQAIEYSEYGAVVRHLATAPKHDIAAIANGLDQFGLVDLSHLVAQAQARQLFLDTLEELIANPSTLESQMHKALERSLWVLGTSLSLFTSNTTLQKTIQEHLKSEYRGERGTQRPDLLLNEDLYGECLLIEFKRPTHALKRADYTQATGYRHELKKYVSKRIKVLLIGGSRSDDYPTERLEEDVSSTTYRDVVASARRELEWKLRTPC